MPNFRYQAIDARGRSFDGSLDAKSVEEAALALDRQGLLVTTLEAVGAITGHDDHTQVIRGKQIPLNVLLDVTDILGSLLNAGMTIEQSLSIAKNAVGNRKGKQLLDDLLHDVRAGSPLSDALSTHQGVPHFYVSLVRNGELSGNLGSMLGRLVEALNRVREVRAQIINASIYPLILILVMMGSLIFLFTRVVPKFGDMFQGASVKIPASTRMLLDFSNFLNNNFVALVLAACAVLLAINFFLKSRAGKAMWDRYALHMPMIGVLFLNLELSRVFRTVGTLLQAGVPLAQAIDNTADVPANGILRKSLRQLHEGLVGGLNLQQAMAQITVLPPFVRQFIQVGDETGRLDEVMLSLAQRMERDVDNMVKRLLAMVEPIAILVMGIVIGFVVVSMLQAVFAINTVQI